MSVVLVEGREGEGAKGVRYASRGRIEPQGKEDRVHLRHLGRVVTDEIDGVDARERCEGDVEAAADAVLASPCLVEHGADWGEEGRCGGMAERVYHGDDDADAEKQGPGSPRRATSQGFWG